MRANLHAHRWRVNSAYTIDSSDRALCPQCRHTRYRIVIVPSTLCLVFLTRVSRQPHFGQASPEPPLLAARNCPAVGLSSGGILLNAIVSMRFRLQC